MKHGSPLYWGNTLKCYRFYLERAGRKVVEENRVIRTPVLTELPNRQRELQEKMDHLLKMNALPSCGKPTSSSPSVTDQRMRMMETNLDNLMTEDAKLANSPQVVEEPTAAESMARVTDRLDNVI